MSLVQQVGYMGIEASDLQAWRAFATEVLGLTVAGETEEGFDLRMDSYRSRFFIRKGPADDVAFLGFEVANEAALAELKQTLAYEKVDVEEVDAATCAQRHVKAMIRCLDPSGVPLEFYCQPERSPDDCTNALVTGGFVAEDQGFGHVVVSCKDPAANVRFYMDVLGFKLSDSMNLKFGPMEFHITFTHVNARHHSLAFASRMPKRIHHFMIQTRDMDEVGKAYDRVRDHGLRVTQELGRHSNDRMFSFYAQTPSGFEFEYGAGAIEIDDAQWVPKIYNRGSDWGHHRPRATPGGQP